MIRYWIILVVLFGSFSCKTGTHTKAVNQDCKKELLTELQRLSTMIREPVDGVYTFDHSQLSIPDDYKHLEWQTDTEVITGLDSVSTQYRVYAKLLTALCTTECQYKFTMDDFIKYYGAPTTADQSQRLVYRFNRSGKLPCYDTTNVPPYKDCSMLIFIFNTDYTLLSVQDFFFWP